MTERSIRVPPWSLNRDLGGCHRCFAEALNGEALPRRFSAGLGKVCAQLDRHQRDFFQGKSASCLSADLPAGVIRNGSGVMSRPFKHEGVALTIRGRTDAIVKLSDNRVLIVDFKSGFPNEHTAAIYVRRSAVDDGNTEAVTLEQTTLVSSLLSSVTL